MASTEANLLRPKMSERWVWVVVDAGMWMLAIYLATWLRLDLSWAQTAVSSTALVAVGVAATHVVVGSVWGPYAVGHLRGSYEEILDLARTGVIAGAVILVVGFWIPRSLMPRSVPITGTALALVAMLALRFIVRAWRSRISEVPEFHRRVVVFGAGEGGRQLLRTMVRAQSMGLAPVAMLDDDPLKARLRVEGVRVRGTRDDLEAVTKKYDADTLAIAVPSADSLLVRDLSDRASRIGLSVLILPPAKEIVGGLTPQHLRDVNLADLLGRRPVRIDLSEILALLGGRSVLVTGAGGSIGSELCRQIAKFNPAKLYLLDRDESGLHETQLSLSGLGLLDSDDIILADIRDEAAVHRAFKASRPDVVFHAAALKHLPLLERFPLEAWNANVLGTRNVLRAAADQGVGIFVNISTDKAADPTCVLGHSKRVAERLTAYFAASHPGRYVSVRFGNVLGSRGSVVHAFNAQIRRGGPVTVTHPDVERFFMLIPEACQLVLEAASIGRDGEVMVLDMGRPVKIAQVADSLIRMSGRDDIEVTYTGLRPGEKLGEDLFSHGEVRRATGNALISAVEVPRLSDDDVPESLADPAEAYAWMRNIALVGQNEQPTATANTRSQPAEPASA